jgi:hypothetical protein
MDDEKSLREKARAILRDGKIPNRRPDRTWGGPGVGAPCSVCGVPVKPSEMEFEVQFACDGERPTMARALPNPRWPARVVRPCVAPILGHATLTMTMCYAHLSPDLPASRDRNDRAPRCEREWYQNGSRRANSDRRARRQTRTK